jgi:hypothetical protein
MPVGGVENTAHALHENHLFPKQKAGVGKPAGEPVELSTMDRAQNVNWRCAIRRNAHPSRRIGLYPGEAIRPLMLNN